MVVAFLSETDNALWKRILKSVHENKGLKASADAFHKVKDGTWAHLLSNDADTSRIRSIIEEGMLVKVENGNSVRFWHDRWCEVGMLKRAFPRLNLYEWENGEISRLKNHIERIKPDRDREDRVVWKHSGSLYYPTKSIGAKMFEEQEPILSKPLINLIWQRFILPRAQLSVWLANLEKLKTGDFLAEKGIINTQLAVCPFCNTETESNSHIPFTCSFAWRSWMKILKWWGISAVLHSRCRNFSIEWFGLVKSRK
ncbi:uncharacterized protein LOC130802539 [Amaranthus tricolor]|uniref:uncharacterized protein LOC130802539 n=1 Tax=Amaranthus tricolor TaxID=29722 RepID=UPI00258F44A5|nr:uncharacterized protein LOC130802539 [Amaranthus tricolor]